jgi:DNA-binding transcriptional MerR regulator
MTVQLLIGEVAKLLGVTTKTIRYYEGIGLLHKPGRTETGYRLYDAQDLLQLYRIKHLQELGLSLERIRFLLQGPERARSAQEILRTLEAEVTAQITALEARREQIRELLAQAPLDLLAQSQEAPTTLKLLQEYLGQQAAVDTATTNVEQLWVQLDAFLWNHAEYQQQQRELIQYMVEHPEERVQIASLITRVTALAGAPAEAKGVEVLADEIIQLRAQNALLATMMSFLDQWERPSAEILGQILTGAAELSPAQRRLFDLVAKRLARETNEVASPSSMRIPQ